MLVVWWGSGGVPVAGMREGPIDFLAAPDQKVCNDKAQMLRQGTLVG